MTEEERATCERNLGVLKKFYGAVDAGISDELAEELFDLENFVLIEADGVPYGGTWQGYAAYQRFCGVLFETWDPLDYKILQYTAGGDLVIIYLQITGTGKTGLTWSMTICEPWRLRDGKIIEVKPHYFDTHRLRLVDGRLPA